jgi:transposase-like protein
MAKCSWAAKSKWMKHTSAGSEKGNAEGVPPAKSLFSAFWSVRDVSSWKWFPPPEQKMCLLSPSRVFVEVVPTTRAKDVLALTVKKVRRGSIVYTDRYKAYDTLMFCGYRHLRVDHGKYFSRGRVYINGLEGFWSYAKERIMKYHGVSPERFPFYLKELEFRYNHRKEDLFSLISKCLCNLVPKRD